jgi:hypothetical protein
LEKRDALTAAQAKVQEKAKTEKQRSADRIDADHLKVLEDVKTAFELPMIKKRALRTMYEARREELDDEHRKGVLSHNEYKREIADLTDLYNAQLQKIRQEAGFAKPEPAPQTEQKREKDPIEKFYSEQVAEEGARLKEEDFRKRLEAAVAKLIDLGLESDRVERGATKFFEEHYPGRRWRQAKTASS